MALTSTLGSPGIEIREVDNSYHMNTSTATTVFIPGFAAQGPVEEVISIGTIKDFETIYGVPTNAAERYFYYTVKAILDNSGNGSTILCSRLPYGAGKGDTVSNAYTMLAYPAVPVIKKNNKIKKSIFAKKDNNLFIAFVNNEDIYKVFADYENITPEVDNDSGKQKINIISIYDANDAEIEVDNTKYELYANYDLEKEIQSYSFIIKGETQNDDIQIVKEFKTTTYDFDQFTFDLAEDEEKFIEAFTVTDESKEIKPIIEEYYFQFDDDNYKNEEFNITRINSANLPIINGNLSNETTGWNTNGFECPQIQIDFNKDGEFDEENIYIADGLMASESIDKDYILHASYTISSKSNTNDQSVKIGSLYIKLKYDVNTEENSSDASTIQNKTIKGLSSGAIKCTFKDAFEIAKSYEGQTFANHDYETDKYSKDVTYIIGSPICYQISLQEYYKIITGESLKWSRKPYNFEFLSESSTSDDVTDFEGDDSETFESKSYVNDFDAIGHAAFIVINTSRSIINNNFEGFYLGLTDNMFITPSDDYTYNAIENVKITTEVYDNSTKIGLYDKIDNTGSYQSINSNRLSFYTDTNHSGSLSKVITRDITSMDTSGTDYDDTISMALFKLTKSTDNNDVLKLNYTIREKYNWSFGKTRLKSLSSSTIPVSYFAENVTEDSSNIMVMVNPYIAEKSFIDTDGLVHGKIRILGNKLFKNLENYEKKYLIRDYTTINSNIISKKYKKISAMYPAKLAQNSIQSWKNMVKQAGITPKFIKNHFKNINTAILENPEEEVYYNLHPLNSVIPFGTYTSSTNTNKVIGELPYKLERALELVKNDEQYPDIDMLLESGLGTIYVNSMSGALQSESAHESSLLDESGDSILSDVDKGIQNVFDENIIVEGIEDLRTGQSQISESAQEVVENYLAVQNVFTGFANSMTNGGRGDTFYISDVPRGILIKGKDTKIKNVFGTVIENNAYDIGEEVNHSFPTSVYYPIKHTFDTIVSSYMSTYAQWVKILDPHSSQKVWIPISGYIAANMAATDAIYGPWYAAAGLRRGVINGVLDYAISPDITQRSDLYKICINSVPKIPNYGVTIWGIRTMSKKDSAFDQNTCRRTFLYMQKKVKQLLRYYIFEPNTSYTRLQIYNDIDPFLESVKNNGGIYSYTLITDTTVNTPEVINNGDLAVQISAAPTRTAENIVVEFIANKYTEEVTSSES